MNDPTFTRRAAVLSLAVLGLAAAVPSRSAFSKAADPAAAKVEAFYEALLASMKQAKQLGPKGRFDKLAPVVQSAFDVPGMTKIACGPAWESIAPPDQAALTQAFLTMTTAEYASRFDDFTGEQFQVGGVADQGTDKVVKTMLVQGNGKAVTLNYLMRNGNGGWRIVDVLLEGTISQINGRRAEFTSILKSGGAKGLITALKTKAGKLVPGV